MNWRVHCGDVRKFCARYDGPPFMAMLTDPPYELGFMGKDWDKSGIAFNSETWAAFARHLLPGAFGMTFASSRGWHRVACAIEDAGLRIHPTVWCWVQGAGFPKATRIKGHEEFAGHRYGLQALKPAVEPIIVWQVPYEGKPVDSIVKHGAGALNIEAGRIPSVDPVPSSLQPDFKIAKSGSINKIAVKTHGAEHYRSGEMSKPSPLGRWPPNFVVAHSPDCRRVGVKKIKVPKHRNPSGGDSQFPHGDETTRPDRGGYDQTDADGLETVEEWRCVESCPVRKLDEQSGHLHAVGNRKTTSRSTLGTVYPRKRDDPREVGPFDSGGASRFFFNSDWVAEVEEGILSADPVRYQAKAGRKERDAGLEGMPEDKRRVVMASSGRTLKDGVWIETHSEPKKRRNPHPTVKPIKLCRWLASLLLPPEQYAPRRILIPFSGASSEMIGAGLAGFEEVVGIEREAEYAEIARARLRHWLPDTAEST